MQKHRTSKKAVSSLVRLGLTRAVPINSQAARVIDARRTKELEEIRSRIKLLNKAMRREKDPGARERLDAECSRLKILLSGQVMPATGPRAMEKARKQLERARWERENRR